MCFTLHREGFTLPIVGFTLPIVGFTLTIVGSKLHISFTLPIVGSKLLTVGSTPPAVGSTLPSGRHETYFCCQDGVVWELSTCCEKASASCRREGVENCTLTNFIKNSIFCQSERMWSLLLVGIRSFDWHDVMGWNNIWKRTREKITI